MPLIGLFTPAGFTLRIAAGLAPLMNLQLRAIETADFERRMAEFEKRLAQAEDNLNGNGGEPGSEVSRRRKLPPCCPSHL